MVVRDTMRIDLNLEVRATINDADDYTELVRWMLSSNFLASLF